MRCETRNPVLPVMGGRSQHRFGDAGLAEALDLRLAAEFFDAKVEGVDRMRIDQNSRNAGAPEHGGGGRAGKAASGDRNVDVSHAQGLGSQTPSLRRE